MAKFLTLVAGAALAVLAATSSAFAETVTLEVVHAWGGHKRFHEPIAKEFMKLHPEIEIKFRTPMASYIDGHQAILRQSLSNDLPDIWYSPYNALGELVAALAPKSQIAELTPFLAKEGEDWVKANYAPNVLALGQVDEKQWAMPFNASTPIVYYNLDLVTKAGGDPDRLPTTWDEMVSLGTKIFKLGDGADGLAYSASEWGDDWLWQALVGSNGGQMMDDAKTKVTFGDESGQRAISLLARIAKETKMPLLTEDQTIQQFAAGKLGVFVGSTAEVRVMGDLVAGNFRWKTGPYPINDKANGGLPTGGNAAVILSQDEQKRQAAWEFIKFATGPEGQKIAVLGSGYMPTNLKASDAAYLGDYYKDHPDWTTSMKQWPAARNWFGYPGNKGTKIWRAQQNILGSVIRGDTSPDEGLKQLVEVTTSLLSQ